MAQKVSKAAKTRKRNKKNREKEGIFRRSLFYAIVMFVLFQVMLLPLLNHMYPFYWMLVCVGFTVVIAELLYSRLSERQVPIYLDASHMRNVKWREHVLHHALLPGLLYASGVLFLFFNRVRVLDQFAIVLLSGTFFVIYYNISATYLKMYRISRNTQMVFDFVNIIVFYFFTDVLINLVLYAGFAKYVVFIGSAVITFILVGMMALLLKQFTREVFVALLVSALAMGIVVVLLWTIPIFNVAVISLVATVGFYLVDAYWHHRLEGTLTWDIMSQYGLFAVMALILLLYI